jgi:hypothetical protein
MKPALTEGSRQPKRRRPSVFYTLLILCAVATGVGAYMMARRVLNAFLA